jgi:YfiH family protein
VTSAWVRRRGWVRLREWEKAFGVFAAVSSRRLGNMKDPANFFRQCEAAGLPPARWAGGQQVHGRRVVSVARPRKTEMSRTDGLVTASAGLTLRILTADCVPVFLIDPAQRAIGLVHAGWRGVQQGIVKRAIRQLLLQTRGRAKDIRAALGPHIQRCCYGVGPDVAGFFQEIPGAVSPRTSGGRGGQTLHLSAVIRAQLVQAGVSGKRITAAPGCTGCDETYFSYRRDRTEHRQAALLCLKPKG